MGVLTVKLRRKRHGARPTECAGELGEDRQVGVQTHPIQSPDAEGEQRPLVLRGVSRPETWGRRASARLTNRALERRRSFANAS